MGTSYDQQAIVGIRLKIEDLKVCDSPAIYENQNRYDTRTGAIKGTERVKVKDEVSHYEFNGKSYDEIYDIESDYKDFKVIISDYHIHIGKDILGLETDYDRVNLLEGVVSFDELDNLRKEFVKVFTGFNPALIFVADVG